MPWPSYSFLNMCSSLKLFFFILCFTSFKLLFLLSLKTISPLGLIFVINLFIFLCRLKPHHYQVYIQLCALLNIINFPYSHVQHRANVPSLIFPLYTLFPTTPYLFPFLPLILTYVEFPHSLDSFTHFFNLCMLLIGIATHANPFQE